MPTTAVMRLPSLLLISVLSAALLGATSLTVSDRGLRHGLLAERFAA